MGRAIVTGVIVAALAFAATQALGREHLRCESEVAARLAELNVEPADIAGIFTVPNYVPRPDPTRLAASRIFVAWVSLNSCKGVTAWVSLNSCKGSVVIGADAYCRVNRAYTRGECRVPDLEAF